MPFKALARFGRARRRTAVEIIPETKPVYDLVLHEIKKRASIRRYLEKGVPAELVDKVLEAARWAPSEGNVQPWEFVVVRDLELKKQLVKAAYHQSWMLSAPVFIIVCTNMRAAKAIYGERGEKLYAIQSIGAAIQNILLAAEALGLGTCWIGAFSEPQVSVLLHCPDWVRPCAILTLGWSAESPPAGHPLELHDIVHFESFGETPLRKKVLKAKASLP